MVLRTDYFKLLRQKYGTEHDVTVVLPPIRTDHTCITDTNRLSILNSPVEYCAECNNTGYIEIPVYQVIKGTVVDFGSEAQTSAGLLARYGDGDFDNQRYVIHADLNDCLSDTGADIFNISKMVIVDGEYYEIFSIDRSRLLGQIRVFVSRRN